jgi:tetratricopeptide (TPR) repeat protein
MERLDQAQLLAQVKDYTEQLERDPDSDVFIALSECYLKLGVQGAALDVVRQGLARNPGHLQGQIALANILCQRGDYDEAVVLFEKVLRQDSQSRDALLGLATLDVQQGNFERAEGYLDRVRSLDPDNEALLDHEDRLEIAREQEDASGEGGPVLVSATVAELYLKQGLKEKAVTAYRTLVHQFPDHKTYSVRLAELTEASVSDAGSEKENVDNLGVVDRLERWLLAIERRRQDV